MKIIRDALADGYRNADVWQSKWVGEFVLRRVRVMRIFLSDLVWKKIFVSIQIKILKPLRYFLNC